MHGVEPDKAPRRVIGRVEPLAANDASLAHLVGEGDHAAIFIAVLLTTPVMRVYLLIDS